MSAINFEVEYYGHAMTIMAIRIFNWDRWR